jgi:hypothetical protein
MQGVEVDVSRYFSYPRRSTGVDGQRDASADLALGKLNNIQPKTH